MISDASEYSGSEASSKTLLSKKQPQHMPERDEGDEDPLLDVDKDINGLDI